MEWPYYQSHRQSVLQYTISIVSLSRIVIKRIIIQSDFSLLRAEQDKSRIEFLANFFDFWFKFFQLGCLIFPLTLYWLILLQWFFAESKLWSDRIFMNSDESIKSPMLSIDEKHHKDAIGLFKVNNIVPPVMFQVLFIYFHTLIFSFLSCSFRICQKKYSLYFFIQWIPDQIDFENR